MKEKTLPSMNAFFSSFFSFSFLSLLYRIFTTFTKRKNYFIDPNFSQMVFLYDCFSFNTSPIIGFWAIIVAGRSFSQTFKAHLKFHFQLLRLHVRFWTETEKQGKWIPPNLSKMNFLFHEIVFSRLFSPIYRIHSTNCGATVHTRQLDMEMATTLTTLQQ